MHRRLHVRNAIHLLCLVSLHNLQGLLHQSHQAVGLLHLQDAQVEVVHFRLQWFQRKLC